MFTSRNKLAKNIGIILDIFYISTDSRAAYGSVDSFKCLCEGHRV